MKPFITAAVGALILATAAPALAQPGGWGGGWDLNRREHWLGERIQRGVQDGSLDRREAMRVRGELTSIRNEQERMRMHNGGRLDDRDRDVLSARLDDLSNRIHWLRANNEVAPWRR